MAQIARRYRVSVADLRAANRMRNNHIRPGQVLTVPSRGEIYVRPGQTLARIARNNRTTVDALRAENRLRRGARLQAGQRLYLPGTRPSAQVDRDWGESDHPGTVVLHRGDQTSRQLLVDTQGRVSRLGVITLERMLQRPNVEEDGARHTSPRLSLLLARIADHFGGRDITIVSGFREARRFTRGTSKHVAGVASDIRVRGVPHRTLWEFCRTHDGVGCGYYPRSTFVHVDVREERAQWVDWSRPGRRPRYGTLRGPTRRGRRPRIPMVRATREIPQDVEVVEDVVTSATAPATAEPAAPPS